MWRNLAFRNTCQSSLLKQTADAITNNAIVMESAARPIKKAASISMAETINAGFMYAGKTAFKLFLLSVNNSPKLERKICIQYDVAGIVTTGAARKL